MEIAQVSESSVKIKGKNATIIVDPEGTQQADIALFLSASGNTSPKIEGLRLSISGPGEYEAGGVKISAIKTEAGLVYVGEIDGGKFVLGSSQSLEKALNELDETPVVIINAQGEFNANIVTTLSPSASVIYGKDKAGALHTLGKEEAQKVNKYVVRSDKLPQEAEIVALG